MLWGASVAAARRGRLVDVLQAVTMARAPFLIAGVLIVLFTPPAAEVMAMIRTGVPGVKLLALSLGSAPFFIWGIVLLYRGFATCVGPSKLRATVAFVVGVVVAQVITKSLLILAAAHLPR